MSSLVRAIKQNTPTYYNAVATSKLYIYANGYNGNSNSSFMQALETVPISYAPPDYSAGLGTNFILRDMGKTVYAPVATPTGPKRYFRRVQILKITELNDDELTTMGSTNGIMGTTTSGSPPLTAYTGATPYFTYYMQVTMNGVPLGLMTGAAPISGGSL
jgi:hypothetical protein